jgi:thymidine phosphorylase
MAAVIRGLSTIEMAALTEAMRDSGETWTCPIRACCR